MIDVPAFIVRDGAWREGVQRTSRNRLLCGNASSCCCCQVTFGDDRVYVRVRPCVSTQAVFNIASNLP
jgi:hypothetical protein